MIPKNQFIKNVPPNAVAHLHFFQQHKAKQKIKKEPLSQSTKIDTK
jgi:hypothetical protein